MNLMMAIETLIVPQDKSDEAIVLVESLIQKAKESFCEEQGSILSALTNLKKESIAAAGRRGEHLRVPGKGIFSDGKKSAPGKVLKICY